MKKKKIASKLLSLMLSAAVIVSSSFGGITLVDANATEVPAEEIVVVSDNTVDDATDVEGTDVDATETEETDVPETEDAAETPAEEETEEPQQEETVEEEPFVKPMAEEPADVQDSSMVEREINTEPQPYISAEAYASRDKSEKTTNVKGSFMLKEVGNYGVAELDEVVPQIETTEGVVEEPEQEAVPDKATTTPSDSALVTSLVGETALATALLQIYNDTYNSDSDIAIASFKFSHLKQMDGTVDLSTASNASSITKATGIGYLVNATEISLKGTKITYIPGSEFWKNSSLVTITLPDTLVGFGDSAFNGCTALVNINSVSGSTVKSNTLPSYLDDAKMGSSIFAGCTALKQITIPDMTQDTYALRPATSMFSGCSGLTSVTIGAQVSVIPNSCFVGAGDKTSGMAVTIASGSVLDTLMDSAFQYCNISEIDLSKCTKLARIGVRCFTPRQSTAKKTATTESKIQLSKVILPTANATMNANGLEIGDEAFFMAPVATICVGSYTEAADGKVVLPNYVKAVGVAAFFGNDAMGTLQLSANIPMINKFTFAECTALTDVTVDTANNNNTCATVGIANQAFYNATNLKDADFLASMNKLTYIGEETWELLDTDEDIQIIDYFSYKTNGYNTKKLYASAVFTGTAVSSATLPASLRTIGAYAFGSASELVTVTWETDSALATGAKYVIGSEAFVGCSALTTFIYPNTGTKKVSFVIEGGAFMNCSALTNFSMISTAASNNSLPIALTKIGIVAFGACTSLQYMKMTDNVNGVCPEIGDGVFAICNKLTTVALPKSIKEIPEDMFYDCGLTSFPALNGGTSLEKIGYGAFFGNKMATVDLSAFTKLHTIGTLAFAYHDPYEDAKDAEGNDVIIVADEILTTIADGEGNEKTVAETSLAPLTTLILPDALTGSYYNMVWGDNMVQAAGKFTTLKTKTRGAAGQVYVPNYILQSETGDSVFAATAVTKATWEYTTKTSGANVWTGIPNGMFAQTPVTKISDCCIPATDVLNFGTLAYAGTKITEVDLTMYPYLKETGDGTFALCCDLVTVKLPKNNLYTKVSDYMFLVGNFENKIGLQAVDQHCTSDTWRSVLETVDFGTVRTIGKFAFATLDEVEKLVSDLEGIDVSDALSEADFSASKVETIGEGAFAGNESLQRVNLKGVTEVGDLAFMYCTNLCMTYDTGDATAVNPFADSVKTIGDYAFASCWSIGEVVFGSELQSLGESAFEACLVESAEGEALEGEGLYSVNFSRATKLASIGKNAFKTTAIKNFDISKCPVTELKEGAVSNCPLLETITLGEKVQKVAKNAAYGCINLGSFEFYSTTTVDLQAFYKKGDFKAFDDQDNIVYITPINKVDFRLTPVELNVGLGNPMMFPYYVNDKKNGSGSFGEIVIGQANVGSEDPTVHQYVKVMANTSEYYKNNTDPSNIVSDSKYFEKTDAIEYAVNNTTVYTFKIQGLKATPANKTIPFSVTSGYTFTADGASAEQTLTAKYNLKVIEIPYYPTLYTDSARLYQFDDLKVNATTGVTTGTTNIRVGEENTTGKMTLYYDITPLYKTNWRPETGNLVVTTSNPDVITFGTGSGMKKINNTTYNMTAEPGSKTDATLSSLTKGKKIVVTPKKQGSSVITIYHKDCPQKKITWTIHVKVDVKSVTCSVPSEFKKGVYEGDNFQLVDKITFYIGGSVTRNADTIKDYRLYTDNTLTFVSKNTSWCTIDKNGIVTILKSSKKGQLCWFTIVLTRPDGTKKTYDTSLEVKYPTFAVGKAARSSNGDRVKIMKKASGKKMAEVIYLAPRETKTSVTIPRTVTVGGVKCKVVGIEEGAFANNKKIKTVKIAKGFTEIPKNMFKGCTKLTKVTLPATITSIGDSAFQGCKVLTKITIPKKVKTIGKKAFYNCSKLKKITVKSKVVTKVGKNAFKGIHKNAVIDVPNSKLKAYKTLFKKGQGKKVKIK